MNPLDAWPRRAGLAPRAARTRTPAPRSSLRAELVQRLGHAALVFGGVVADLEAELDRAAEQVLGLEQAVERRGALVLEAAQAVEPYQQFFAALGRLATGLAGGQRA